MQIEGKILRFFPNVDLRNNHDGLTIIARRGNSKEKGIDPANLQDGQYLVFVNNNKDKLKLFTSKGIFYMKSKSGKLDLNVIASIPQAFNGQFIDYDRALKERLERHFTKKSVDLKQL